MSFTTKSLSVPVDDTVSDTEMGPATARSSSSGPVEYTSTSGRVAANRWSSVM